MNEIHQVIQNALDRYRGIRRKRAALAGLGALVLVLTLAALCDRVWMFTGWARWSGWIAGVAIAAWTARRAAGSSSPDASSLAHRVEAEAGETAPVVATAIDPAVRRSASEPFAQTLLDRLDRRAAEAIRIAPPTFKGKLQKPAAVAAVALAALLGVVALQGGQGLLRMLFPWQSSPYTSLVLEGPKGLVAEGQAFTLTAQVSGVPVDKVILSRQGSADPLAEAAPDEQGFVQLAVPGLDGPADFVVRGGDGRSEPLQVEPYLLPGIEAFEIAVTPPAYGAHAADTETTPSFAAFRGSQLRYRLHLKAPAVSLAVERSVVPREEERVTDEERATLKRGAHGVLVGPEEAAATKSDGPVFRPDPADPLVWEADWALPDPEDILYRLVIEGEHGDRIRNDEPWRISVLDDTPPKARIHAHNGAEVIQIGDEKVRFDLSAVDDVSLAEVRLVFRKPGQPHTRQVIALPQETRRTWSGAELLDLAPLDLGLFDLVAVHLEAQDANTIDGPGIGRSEVVYLEVPLPESDDAGSEGGGGGGGGGPPPINPLELQMEILRSTIALPRRAPEDERESLAHDQRQNAEYTRMIESAVGSAGLAELWAALHKAQVSMESAAELLDTQPPAKAIPDEEAALGYLIEAAKLLEDAKEQLPPAESEEGMVSFTLRPPPPGGPPSDQGEMNAESEREELRKLTEEVRRQLAEQEALNQSTGENAIRAESQQAMAGDARSAASRARGVPASASGRGDPQAAAEELERAAALQDDNSEALTAGDEKAIAQLGAKSAEALAEALRELSARLKTDTFDSEAATPGYERLINDYLRAISYE